jgi:uncharacterized membrane protein YsdA (DUF1294 family)
MIQRVQTLFMLGVALCMGLLFMAPLWEKVSEALQQSVLLNAFGLYHLNLNEAEGSALISEKNLWFLAVLAGLSVVVALFNIFQYKNRLTQIKLNALNSLLIGAFLVTSVWFMREGNSLLAEPAEGNMQWGFFLPVAALLLNWLASRFIRKDELLVRSADRFR